jgi:hypothetical protein
MKLKQHDEQIMSQSKVGRYILMPKRNSKHSIRKENIRKTEDICQICNKRDADIFHDDGMLCLYCWQEHTHPNV